MENIVIKIGGSLLYDDNLNINKKVLDLLTDWYQREKGKYNKIVFVVGGGKIGRFVLNQVKERVALEVSRHRIAMKMTQVNAALIQGILSNEDSVYVDHLENISIGLNKPNIKSFVIGGVVEGWSTDMDAAVIASNIGTGMIYKISNIDYIYNKDPKEFADAVAIKNLRWSEYMSIFLANNGTNDHKPNMNVPIDAHCAQHCMENNLKFRVAGGKDIENATKLEDLFALGTLVE